MPPAAVPHNHCQIRTRGFRVRSLPLDPSWSCTAAVMHAYSETVLGLRIHLSMEAGHNQRTESRYSISPHAYRLTGMHSGTHRYCTDLSTRTRTEDKKQGLFLCSTRGKEQIALKRTVVSARARPEPCADTERVVSERARDECTTRTHFGSV